MVKRIKFKQYRKFGQGLEITFQPGVNIVSGVNGSCKTSLLHIISNAYKKLTQSTSLLREDERGRFLKIFSKITKDVNPKIEALTKGDKEYNDPAIGCTGVLFEVDYFNFPSLGFRRHNSKKTERYALKPQYGRDSKEKLPPLPVVYLGLSRILPIGEHSEENLSATNTAIPPKYQTELCRLYQEFTALEISNVYIQQMGQIKKRGDFKTRQPGVDSNTISAGEDNLYIILTSLVMLRYYYETLTEPQREVESVLLIDELDATLHPSIQIKLLHKLAEYAATYKIQIVFTTHSLTILEEALSRKNRFECPPKIIYLTNDESSVELMQRPDVKRIKMHLNNLSRAELFAIRDIPVIVEDSEAEKIVAWMFDYFADRCPNFKNYIKNSLKIIPLKIGSDSLKTLFQSQELQLPMFLVLDGDVNIGNARNILKLPGNVSPEEYLYNYAQKLHETDDYFWNSSPESIEFPGKQFFRDHIKLPVEKFQQDLKTREESDDSVKGEKRKKWKKIFQDKITFFQAVFRYWLRQSENQEFLKDFYLKMGKLFAVIARDYGLDPTAWPKLPDNDE